MNRATIEARKSTYVQMGKEALAAAQRYLTEYADTWDRAHENEWLNMVHSAEVCMTKAVAMDEILEVSA